MKKTIVIVFLAILALHIAALLLFVALHDKDAGTDKSGAPEEAAPPPEPTLIAPSPKKRTKKIPRKPRVGIPKFSLDKAAGEIPGLPFEGKAGILVDLDTGKALWAKNADKPVPIASMTKMMTALLAFEDLRDGKIKMDTKVKISKKAASIGGSDIWLDPRETVSFRDLLKAMLIKSANDAAYQIAERLGGKGGVEAFVKRMNAKAAALGLKNTRFHNPHGLPGKTAKDDNMSTCRELATLSALLLRFPEAVKITSTRMTYIPRTVGKYKKTQLVSTNGLVRRGVPGVDGMKTGYTRRSGSCLTATCRRKGRRLIAVVAGFKHSSDRDVFVKKLLDWGYRAIGASKQ